MDWEKLKTGLVEKAIITLLAAAVGVLLMNGGNGTTAIKLDQIISDLAEIKQANHARDSFDRCADKRLDRLEHSVVAADDCENGRGD